MTPRLISLGMHAMAIALLLTISTQLHVSHPPGTPVHFYQTRLVSPFSHRGGGGGGERSSLSASRGRLPQLARRQFTPPSATPPAVQTVLVMAPALIVPADVQLPEIDLAQLGNPLGRDGALSSGPGNGGGIGDGAHGGVGSNRGPGYGLEDGGGFSATSATGRVTAPTVLYKVEPEFSEEARKAKYQGTVILTIEVGEDGKPRDLRVVRGLGLGLDEKAVEAVSRWKFRPAQKNGGAVPATARVEVNFRLL
jgi:protein TonB